MKVAFGLKAHSGWGVLVAVGLRDGEFHVLERRRIELIEEKDANWAKQPYHAAEGLKTDAASDLVTRGIGGAKRSAVREMRAALHWSHELGHEIVACAVLVPDPMPDWTTNDILAVHFRMHKAEGVLFPDALARGALACGLHVATVREKVLWEQAEAELAIARGALMKRIAELGKVVGPPWGQDQKNAALAAMMALGKPDGNG